MARRNMPSPAISEPESPGRFMIALGGLLGFGVCFFGSLYIGGQDVPMALLVGSIACVLCALAMKSLAVYIEKHVDRIRIERVEAERERRRREEEEDEAYAFEDEATEEKPPVLITSEET